MINNSAFKKVKSAILNGLQIELQDKFNNLFDFIKNSDINPMDMRVIASDMLKIFLAHDLEVWSDDILKINESYKSVSKEELTDILELFRTLHKQLTKYKCITISNLVVGIYHKQQEETKC